MHFYSFGLEPEDLFSFSSNFFMNGFRKNNTGNIQTGTISCRVKQAWNFIWLLLFATTIAFLGMIHSFERFLFLIQHGWFFVFGVFEFYLLHRTLRLCYLLTMASWPSQMPKSLETNYVTIFQYMFIWSTPADAGT